jgi:hypothetical protein
MPGAMHEIADALERLSREIREVADGAVAPGTAAGRDQLQREAEEVIAQARARLHSEADRVVAAAGRVLEAAPSAAIAQAEADARERILAVTEAVCERIEAVDHAQERVAEALNRIAPSSPKPG